MKFWRRCAALLLVLSVLAGAAGAYEVAEAGGNYLDNVNNPGCCNDPARQARMLQSLGLFQGTDQGFALKSPLTRAQAAVLLTRVLGGEAAALDAPPAHPFTDVPAWADAYVGWLYETGLTNGVGGSLYGSNRNIRFEEFAAMLVRALYGAGTAYGQWTRLGTEAEAEYWAQYENFPRSASLGLLVRALLQEPAPGADTLLQRLHAKGLFTAEALGRAAYGVLPAAYRVDASGVLRRYVGGVDVAQCPVEGLTLAEDSLDLPQDVLYASKRENGGLTICQIDCDTLTVTGQGRAPSADAIGVSQMGGWDGGAYLAELRPGRDGPIYGAVLGWTGAGLKPYWTAAELWNGEAVPAGDGRLQCGGDGTLMALRGTTLRLRRGERAIQAGWPQGGELLAYTDQMVVGKRRLTDGTLELFCVASDSGETVQTLQVPPRDFGGGPTALDLAQQDETYFTGSAGTYALGEHGLGRLTDQPTVEVTMTRMLWPYFLTYTPGVTPLLDGRQTGDAVYTLDNDGQTIPVLTDARGVRLLSLPEYNIAVGMNPDGVRFTYMILRDYLGVQSVQDETLLEAAKEAALEQEIQRLREGGGASWPEDGEILLQSGDRAVGTARRADGTLEILNLDARTGAVLQRYEAPPVDYDGDGAAEPRELHEDRQGILLGTAGAFRLEQDRLLHLSDRPCLQGGGNRRGVVYLLCYTPGVTPLYQGRQTADTICVGEDGEDYIYLSPEDQHGMQFLEIYVSDTCSVKSVHPDGFICYHWVGYQYLFFAGLEGKSIPDEEWTAIWEKEYQRLEGLDLLPY